jgi:hypothetical protein
MKNLLFYLILFISGSILFTSCNQNMSLTKRHYRNGYHVEYASKRPVIKSKETEAPEISMSEITGKTVKETQATETNQPILREESIAQTNTANSNKNPEPVFNKKSSAKRSSVHAKPFADVITPQAKTDRSKLSIKDKFQAAKSLSRDDDAHSLFWIVITIIAILYLIALVTGGWGLGGAIHVLLVIALVLLILWLLRII